MADIPNFSLRSMTGMSSPRPFMTSPLSTTVLNCYALGFMDSLMVMAGIMCRSSPALTCIPSANAMVGGSFIWKVLPPPGTEVGITSPTMPLLIAFSVLVYCVA